MSQTTNPKLYSKNTFTKPVPFSSQRFSTLSHEVETDYINNCDEYAKSYIKTIIISIEPTFYDKNPAFNPWFYNFKLLSEQVLNKVKSNFNAEKMSVHLRQYIRTHVNLLYVDTIIKKEYIQANTIIHSRPPSDYSSEKDQLDDNDENEDSMREEEESVWEEVEEEEEEPQKKITIPTENVNICFVGGVSTGKSTILNSIFCEQLTQCKIKRTTMVPAIYIENNNNPFHITPTEEIYRQITEKNTEIIQKTENGEKINKNDYAELVFNVGKLDINILQNAYVNVYDIPGLNDARTKDIYYQYLENNFHKFNLLTFIVDIHSGLNTSDEIDIVNFITSNTRHQLDTNNKKIYTMVIVNKADDMRLDDESEETDKLALTGELEEMYEQVEKTIRTEFERKNLSEHLIGIMPLCAVDAYLYRMVTKHGKEFKLTPEQILKIGVNENGKRFSTLKPATQAKKVYEILEDKKFINEMIKLSGFSCLEKTLHKFLNENNNGNKIRVDNLLFELSKQENMIDNLKKSRSLYSATFKTLVDKQFIIYEAIKNIDFEIYETNMLDLLCAINVTLKINLPYYEYNRISELITDYKKIETNVFKVYFQDYCDTTDYPEFIKERVFELIARHTQNSYAADFTNFEQDIITLKKTNQLEYETDFVCDLVKTIISKNSIKLYNKSIINVLEELKSLDIDLEELLRFILLNKIKLELHEMKHDLLFQKKMLYKMYKEIPLQTYLTLILPSLKVSNEVVIKGLNEETMLNPEIMLDLYYLEYHKAKTIKTIL